MGEFRDRYTSFKKRHGKRWVVVLVFLALAFIYDRIQDVQFAVEHRSGFGKAAALLVNSLFSNWFLIPAFVLVTAFVLWRFSQPPMGGSRLIADGTVYTPESTKDEPPTPDTSRDWIPQFRAYIRGTPVAGSDGGAAHIGDYPSREKTIEACRVQGSFDFGPCWIEPIEYNGNPHAPIYRNGGPIELVDLGRSGWTAECRVASADLETGAGVFLSVKSADEGAAHIRCRVRNRRGQFYDSRTGSVFSGTPPEAATSESKHYPYDFGKPVSLDPGMYEAVWLGDFGDFLDPKEEVLQKSWFRIDQLGRFMCGP